MTRRVLLLFVDGIGLGLDDPAVNPIAAARTPFLDGLLGRKMTASVARVQRNGALLIPTDATLGVEGLPQSATGQTALLTGINASQVVGRHVTAYPTTQLKAMLAASSIFKRVQDMGGSAALANAYTPEYFSAVQERRLRYAAITFSAISAGVRLRGLDDLRAGRAVFHDLTNSRPRSWGHDLPEISPEQAGRNLAGIAAEHDLTLFEFFLTDLAAHQRIPLDTVTVVEMLDGLLRGVVQATDRDEMLVIMTSDHGNLEDAWGTVHTRNPVPTLLIGEGRHAVGRAIHTLTDIAPGITAWLAEDHTRG